MIKGILLGLTIGLAFAYLFLFPLIPAGMTNSQVLTLEIVFSLISMFAGSVLITLATLRR